MTTSIKPGSKFTLNNRTWTVSKVAGGRVYCATPGIPTQSIDWLMFQQRLDNGLAKMVS